MPTYAISMTKEFWEDLNKLDQSVRMRTERLVNRIVEDPWAPEIQAEKIHAAEDGTYSSRVNDSYRLIFKYIQPKDIIICMVDQHDRAYKRASRKCFTMNDGVIKYGNILETEATSPAGRNDLFGMVLRQDKSRGALFIGYKESELLALGVPSEILPNILALENVNQLDNVERLLPADVFDRLVEVALGLIERPRVPDKVLSESLGEYQGGDDLYRFVDGNEFKRVLEGSLEEWMLFLAPHQRALVNRVYNGPTRIKGVAGSGKTVVALHRAYFLARKYQNTGKKILFLTYGSRLPEVNKHLLCQLTGNEPAIMNSIECLTIHQWCSRFLLSRGIRLGVIEEKSQKLLEQALDQIKKKSEEGFPLANKAVDFFRDEIRYVIKGRDISSLEDYLALSRSGRGTRLTIEERKCVWEVYIKFQDLMELAHVSEYDDLILRSIQELKTGGLEDQYSSVIVDEIQDLTESTMKLIRMIVPPGPDDLFLVGDGLQRIYPGGYYLANLGIDIVGRGTVLRKNYRNTQQILQVAHAMMENTSFDDMDDEPSEAQIPEYSVRTGAVPRIRGFQSVEKELGWISKEIQRLISIENYSEKDIAIVYRYSPPYEKPIEEIIGANFTLVKLKKDAETYFGNGIKYSTFHSVKGLEFKVVFIVGVTDGWMVPKDKWDLNESALDDYLERERRLLYVAMTRARDLLYFSYSRGVASRFLNNIPEEMLKRVY
ncbi:DNA helicase [Leptolinea sp. HRD-7]|nr:DNA helicase [Leptolinea sp. HRD-7]